MRQNIHVTSFTEFPETIMIQYNFKGKQKNLIIDRVEDTQLMQLFTSPLNQYDAICIAAQHEENMATQKWLDITRSEDLFGQIANICKTHNQIHYGV